MCVWCVLICVSIKLTNICVCQGGPTKQHNEGPVSNMPAKSDISKRKTPMPPINNTNTQIQCDGVQLAATPIFCKKGCTYLEPLAGSSVQCVFANKEVLNIIKELAVGEQPRKSLLGHEENLLFANLELESGFRNVMKPKSSGGLEYLKDEVCSTHLSWCFPLHQ